MKLNDLSFLIEHILYAYLILYRKKDEDILDAPLEEESPDEEEPEIKRVMHIFCLILLIK